MRPPTPVSLTDEERVILESTVSAATSEQRMAFRARVVLAAAEGRSTEEIAKSEHVRTATVSKVADAIRA